MIIVIKAENLPSRSLYMPWCMSSESSHYVILATRGEQIPPIRICRAKHPIHLPDTRKIKQLALVVSRATSKDFGRELLESEQKQVYICMLRRPFHSGFHRRLLSGTSIYVIGMTQQKLFNKSVVRLKLEVRMKCRGRQGEPVGRRIEMIYQRS